MANRPSRRGSTTTRTRSAGGAGNGHFISSKYTAEQLKTVRFLDVGCGENKQPYCVGMDKRAAHGVDVVHDANVLPWPFEDSTFDRIYISHLMEHLFPWLHLEILNELWRIMRPEGDLVMAMPYPGSPGFWQDPTHIKSWNEATPLYFDPYGGNATGTELTTLYSVYRPRPWRKVYTAWNHQGNIEFHLRKRWPDETSIIAKPALSLPEAGKGTGIQLATTKG